MTMGDVETIRVDADTSGRTGAIKAAIKQAIFWSYLVCAEAVSHLWFGGSWIIDLIILIFLFIFALSRIEKFSGSTVCMTRDELRMWVAAGMPSDVKEWRARQKLVDAA